MLFQRMNDGCTAEGNNASEVVKVLLPTSSVGLILHTNWTKYINTVLKVDFDLDSTSKPKPVIGPDNLLLLLVQHWARDESVFPTGDNQHSLATIMLFNAYTGGRSAEFVHTSKGKPARIPSVKQISPATVSTSLNQRRNFTMTRAMLVMNLRTMEMDSLTTMT